QRWRLFVAVPIGEELREALREPLEKWRNDDALADLRWADPASWHLTLAFLGSTEASAVSGLLDRLAPVAEAHGATTATTGGLGAFPTAARARIAWYGIEDGDARIARLAADVGAALGLDMSRPLRPHLTLARVRRQPVDLRPWLAAASAPEGELVADRIELMRSHLGRGPAQYETLATMKLGVPASV
ncbi:MAG TPA: RNA 2',3'-cyclic phosphodiesterase, partial [Candidatus Limnocylindrales bacterium]|nr:RNA 2',3'-cyclic phosphodiesterase [Candidatus Limnocylindrales bacterium]